MTGARVSSTTVAARRRSEIALIEGLAHEKLQGLDKLLEIDPAIGQTRFHWLRSAPEAPTASNLIGLTERITFQRTLEIDPGLQTRVASGRWDQMVREGNATPAWLANDFNTSRRHTLIVAQVIKLGEKLTDDAVMMFIKPIGRLFSQAHSRKKRRHMDYRTDTSKALRLFLDTISSMSGVEQHVTSVNLDSLSDLVGGAQAIGHDGQTRIDPAARREEGRIDDIQVVEVMSAVVAVEHARARIVADTAGAARVTAVELARRFELAHVEDVVDRALEAIDHQLRPMAQFGRIAIGIDDVLVRASFCGHVVFEVGEILEDGGKRCPRTTQERPHRCNTGEDASRQML